MPNPLVLKLNAYTPLTADDAARLDALAQNPKRVPAHRDLIREGEEPDDVYLILQGFACRYKVTTSGNRQIMAYLLPGDICDLHVFVLKQMDHTLATISPCDVVTIPRATVLELLESPTLSRALWYSTLVDSAVLREWLVNIGQRSGEERVAHVLCELMVRMRVVGLSDGTSFRLPITQAELADTMGLSAVHVNRVLQQLRRDGLITWIGDELVICDPKRLMTFSGFIENYLHIAEKAPATRSLKTSMDLFSRKSQNQ